MQRRFTIRNQRRRRTGLRVRRKVHGTPERPRLSVFRSHKQIYAQAVDDLHGVTLAASSSQSKDLREKVGGNKTAVAKLVGEDLARRLLERGVKQVVFDRGWYRYHGRIKALADGARAAGLEF